jgi:uncharacterized membrane protein
VTNIRQIKMDTKDSSSPRIVKLVVLGLLAMGVALRFANLDLKVYGHDEIITLVRVAGFTRQEVRRQFFNGREIGIEDIQKFQRAGSERDWTYTVKSLATEVPQHAPLYFVMARLWAEWFGSSAAATRSLPVFLSLLMFPCIYWLCLQLFRSSLVGWIAMALLAISPFHVLYAQQARPYSLLSLAALLSSGALLRAMRVQTTSAWLAYAGTVAFGLYSQLLFSLVLAGHGVYVVVTERFRINRLSIAYAASVAGGMVAFTPWLIIVAGNFSAIEGSMSWSAVAMSFPSMTVAWAGDFGRIFVDSGWMGSNLSRSNLHLGFVALLIGLNAAAAAMVLYSLWFLWRSTPKWVWLFIFTLIGMTSLPLIAADLVLDRRLSTSGRYFLPAYLGVQLAVAYLLAATMKASSGVWQRRIWQQVGVLLALSGLISCVFMSRAPVWWSHSHVYHNPSVARIINRSSQALLISESSDMEIFSLSYLLNPKIRLQLVGNTMPEIAGGDRDIFLFRPSEALRKRLEKSYRLEPSHERGGLWKLKAPSTPKSGWSG